MKLAKLSLAAIVVAGLASHSFAADSLADAFKNGKVTGELRAWYFDRDTDVPAAAGGAWDRKKGDANIINMGVILNYVTDSFYGLKMGATFQSNYAPFADDEAKALFYNDMYGSGAVLSEMYVQYTIDKTTAKVGRQFINTPLIAGSGSRMIRQSFEGALITNTNLPDTTLAAGYISKWQNRTSPDTTAKKSDVGEFERFNDDGAYTLLAINKSIPGLTITGQWAQVVDVADVYYAELAYAGKMNDFRYGLAGQYLITDYDESGKDDGSFYGIKASFGIGAFNMYVAYAEVDDDNDASVSADVGGADPIYTANVIHSGEYKAGSKGYAIDANYEVVKGAKIGARYSDINMKAAKSDYDVIDLYANYTFDGPLKGFGVEVQYETKDKDASTGSSNELRFRANYKF
ncbi:OprD family outer membrane porin [Sulfurospirillum barnesii]|uniref:Outer membrane porin, OprD family n=1 Tax=Sulfurospirillum barnesii (strain ATCC 700032 / DSM 10660 / SES-3) TaxID=760154 RepID=I3XUU3_SULBS|nr:OprD family outer membrane porin [Sulfurospirillum barnesii]AFL67717.1 outer membrane porin, OprD family [Sulfurospirillum barnesii SES-3]